MSNSIDPYVDSTDSSSILSTATSLTATAVASGSQEEQRPPSSDDSRDPSPSENGARRPAVRSAGSIAAHTQPLPDAARGKSNRPYRSWGSIRPIESPTLFTRRSGAIALPLFIISLSDWSSQLSDKERSTLSDEVDRYMTDESLVFDASIIDSIRHILMRYLGPAGANSALSIPDSIDHVYNKLPFATAHLQVMHAEGVDRLGVWGLDLARLEVIGGVVLNYGTLKEEPPKVGKLCINSLSNGPLISTRLRSLRPRMSSLAQ
jgi:hypothetical protein